MLILGADGRNGLAAAGGLKGHGFRLVGVGQRARSRALMALRSWTPPRVFDEMEYIPPFGSDQIPDFLEAICRLVEEHEVDVVLPTGTHYTMWLSERRVQLPSRCILPLDDHEKIERLHDKLQAVRLCEELGVPTPATNAIESRAHLETVALQCSYPVVLKARKGAGNNGVWVARSEAELLDLYDVHIQGASELPDAARDRTSPIVQEFVPGELHDVTSFSVGGEPRALLSQVRLMTAPLWGGGGVVNRTTDDPRIRDYAARIIEAVGWHGILEFDFKLDSRDGTPRLIEINPKIWGTTWLTIQAGFNVPLYLVKEALQLPYDVPDSYEVGLTGRWPGLEADTWFERPAGPLVVIKRVGAWLRRFARRNVVYDFELAGPLNLAVRALASSLGGLRGLVRGDRAGRT